MADAGTVPAISATIDSTKVFMDFPRVKMSELSYLLAVTKDLATSTASLSAIFVTALAKVGAFAAYSSLLPRRSSLWIEPNLPVNIAWSRLERYSFAIGRSTHGTVARRA